MDQELIALNLISNSGTARTKAFEALHKAREGKYEEAKILLKESEESSSNFNPWSVVITIATFVLGFVIWIPFMKLLDKQYLAAEKEQETSGDSV